MVDNQTVCLVSRELMVHTDCTGKQGRMLVGSQCIAQGTNQFLSKYFPCRLAWPGCQQLVGGTLTARHGDKSPVTLPNNNTGNSGVSTGLCQPYNGHCQASELCTHQ